MATKELRRFGEWLQIYALPHEAARVAVLIGRLCQGRTIEKKDWDELNKFITFFEEQFQLDSFSTFEKCLQRYIPARWGMVCETIRESKSPCELEWIKAYRWLTDRLADLKSVRTADKAILEQTRDFLIALSDGVSRELLRFPHSFRRFAVV